MAEKDEYCTDIIQQNLAAIGLLRKAHEMLMGNYLKTHFKKAFKSKNERNKKKMIEEISKVAKLFIKR